jgi:hypothetical protein
MLQAKERAQRQLIIVPLLSLLDLQLNPSKNWGVCQLWLFEFQISKVFSNMMTLVTNLIFGF